MIKNRSSVSSYIFLVSYHSLELAFIFRRFLRSDLLTQVLQCPRQPEDHRPGFAIRRLTATQQPPDQSSCGDSLSPSKQPPFHHFPKHLGHPKQSQLHSGCLNKQQPAAPSPAQGPSGGIPWVHSHRLLPNPKPLSGKTMAVSLQWIVLRIINVCRHLVKCPWAKLQTTLFTLSLFKHADNPS